LLEWTRGRHAEALRALVEEEGLTDELQVRLRAILEEFLASRQPSSQPAKEA